MMIHPHKATLEQTPSVLDEVGMHTIHAIREKISHVSMWRDIAYELVAACRVCHDFLDLPEILHDNMPDVLLL